MQCPFYILLAIASIFFILFGLFEPDFKTKLKKESEAEGIKK